MKISKGMRAFGLQTRRKISPSADVPILYGRPGDRFFIINKPVGWRVSHLQSEKSSPSSSSSSTRYPNILRVFEGFYEDPKSMAYFPSSLPVEAQGILLLAGDEGMEKVFANMLSSGAMKFGYRFLVNLDGAKSHKLVKPNSPPALWSTRSSLSGSLFASDGETLLRKGILRSLVKRQPFFLRTPKHTPLPQSSLASTKEGLVEGNVGVSLDRERLVDSIVKLVDKKANLSERKLPAKMRAISSSNSIFSPKLWCVFDEFPLKKIRQFRCNEYIPLPLRRFLEKALKYEVCEDCTEVGGIPSTSFFRLISETERPRLAEASQCTYTALYHVEPSKNLHYSRAQFAAADCPIVNDDLYDGSYNIRSIEKILNGECLDAAQSFTGYPLTLDDPYGMISEEEASKQPVDSSNYDCFTQANSELNVASLKSTEEGSSFSSSIEEKLFDKTLGVQLYRLEMPDPLSPSSGKILKVELEAPFEWESLRFHKKV